MATQLETTSFRDFPIQTTPPRNIRVAFIAGEAVQAVAKRLAEMPADDRDATADEAIVADLTHGLIASAKEHLSPSIYSAYLRWAEAASHHSTLWEDDAEGERRSVDHSASLLALADTRCVNVHDVALKAYCLAVPAGDNPSFGPIAMYNEESRYHTEALAYRIADDLIAASPVIAAHQTLTWRVWEMSGERPMGIAPRLGHVMTAAFSYARSIDAIEREGRLGAETFSSEYDRFARGPLIAWRRAYRAFREADAAMKAHGDGPHDAAFDRLDAAEARAAAAGIDASIACVAECEAMDAEQKIYDGLVSAQDQALRALMRCPAPGPGELAIKLQIGHDQDILQRDYDDVIGRQLVLDAHRFGRQRRILPAATLDDHTAWTNAYSRYQQLRAAGDAIADSDPAQDAAVSAWCDAMDHLVMATPAPDLTSVITKLELSLERWVDYPFPEEFSDAILDDLRKIARAIQAPRDPLVGQLAERNDLIARLNDAECPPSEAEMEEGCGRLNQHDARILAEPATSTDGLISKLLVAVQLTAEGHELDQSTACDLVAEAQRMTGQGTLAGASA